MSLGNTSRIVSVANRLRYKKQRHYHTHTTDRKDLGRNAIRIPSADLPLASGRSVFAGVFGGPIDRGGIRGNGHTGLLSFHVFQIEEKERKKRRCVGSSAESHGMLNQQRNKAEVT